MLASIAVICLTLLHPELAVGFMPASSRHGGAGLTLKPEVQLSSMGRNLKPTHLKSAQESLTNDEISRYSRHLVLGDVGMKGQTSLKNASVLVIGAGGLGSPCLMYLAAAGIGHIGIVVSVCFFLECDGTDRAYFHSFMLICFCFCHRMHH